MHLENKRQLFHISFGTLLALLYHFQIIDRLEFLLFFLAEIVLFLTYSYYKIPVFHQFVMHLERKKNLTSFPGIGAIMFMLGCLITVSFYPEPIAVASILILAWGDAVSAFVGRAGSHPYFNPLKKWEGIVSGIIVATLSAHFFVPLLHALLASTIAMLIEGMDPHIGRWKIDDNLFIPIISGAILLAMS